jgi:hypothetical protein
MVVLAVESENDIGVRQTAIAAICFTVLGGLLLIPYKKKRYWERLQRSKNKNNICMI